MLDAVQRMKLALALRVGLVRRSASASSSWRKRAVSRIFRSPRVFEPSRDFLQRIRTSSCSCRRGDLFALCMGVPLTALVLRKAKACGVVFASLGIVQTIPSIALFGVLIAPLSALSRDLPFLPISASEEPARRPQSSP